LESSRYLFRFCFVHRSVDLIPSKSIASHLVFKNIETCNDEGTTAITSYTTPGPPVSPFFVFERDRIEFLENSSDALVSIEEGATLNTEEEGIDTEEEAPTNDFDFDPFDDEFKEDEGPIEIIQQVIIGSVWYWWKEILGISLFTTVILNILILKPLIRSVRMETVREVLRSFNIWYESERGVSTSPSYFLISKLVLWKSIRVFF
jgi:hypothetical protein